MLWTVGTGTQGTETWKEIAKSSLISAYNPLFISQEASGIQDTRKGPEASARVEDKAAFGTHLREAARILRGKNK